MNELHSSLKRQVTAVPISIFDEFLRIVPVTPPSLIKDRPWTVVDLPLKTYYKTFLSEGVDLLLVMDIEILKLCTHQFYLFEPQFLEGLRSHYCPLFSIMKDQIPHKFA